MKKIVIFSCYLLLSGLLCQGAVASDLSLELDRVFYSDPSFKWIHGTAYDNDGYLWVTDYVNDSIAQYDPNQPNGATTTPLSSFSLFNIPDSSHVRDTAWDHDTDTLWVAFADGGIFNCDKLGNVIASFSVAGEPSGLAYHNHELFVSFNYGSMVEKYSRNGSLQDSFAFQGSVESSRWSALAYDEDRDLLWVKHRGSYWQAYNPSDRAIVAEFDSSIFEDPPWDIGLSYGDGALWTGTANTLQYQGNEIVGRVNVLPPIIPQVDFDLKKFTILKFKKCNKTTTWISGTIDLPDLELEDTVNGRVTIELFNVLPDDRHLIISDEATLKVIDGRNVLIIKK